MEDFYDDPASAINRAVDAHPAVQEARQVVADTKRKELEGQVTDFQTRHPDYQQIGGSPEFQSWIAENPLRVDLYRKADAYDFTAADALFSLYKAEKGISQMQQEASQAQQIEAASLEASSELMVQEPPRYSRSEYVNKLMRAKQGDLEAEEWVKRNAAGYRQALAVGNVRD
ncbi:MAG: hypothetical protein GTO49_17195 [Anaerolineae bacterium]|nr:hypothetical protein [Anaerolineae bacterium]